MSLTERCKCPTVLDARLGCAGAEFVFQHQAVKGAAGHVCQQGSLGNIPLRFEQIPERACFSKCLMARDLPSMKPSRFETQAVLNVQRQVFGFDRHGRGQDHRALDNVFQLAEISRLGIVSQQGNGSR